MGQKLDSFFPWDVDLNRIENNKKYNKERTYI